MKKIIFVLIFSLSVCFLYSHEYLLSNPEFGITPEVLLNRLGVNHSINDMKYTAVFYRSLWNMFSDISTSQVTSPMVYFKENSVKFIHFTERDNENREWSIVYYFFSTGDNNFRLFMIEKDSNNHSSNARNLIESRAQSITNTLRVNTTISSTTYQALNGRTQSALIASWQTSDNFHVLATNNTHSYFLIFSINLWREYSNFIK